jgi:small nuclear ribonucleoprotein (snRNP)-like protein
MTINSVITNLCWQFGKVTHTDKMLADKCRLISALLGQGWERVDRENKNNDEEKTREERGTTDAEATRVELHGGNYLGEKDDPLRHEYSTTNTTGQRDPPGVGKVEMTCHPIPIIRDKDDPIKGVFSIGDARKQEYFSTRRLGILTRPVENNSQVLINCRDNRILLGRVSTFDKRCNMALKEVTVMWIRVSNMETKGETVAPLYRDRFVIRILSILKIKEQAPSSEDSESVTTQPPLAQQGIQMP